MVLSFSVAAVAYNDKSISDHASPEVVAESTDKTYPAVEATGKIT